MDLVEALCARLDGIVPWDAGAVHSYTALQRSIMREQRTHNMNDVMVAAHAMSLDAMLLSGNDKVFGSMPGLDFRHWDTEA
jgi:tRNA(fMet)-specific endonuclease VapC